MVGFPAIAERVGLTVRLANLAGASLLRVEANVLIRRVDQLKLCALLQRKRKRVQLESLGKRELKSEA